MNDNNYIDHINYIKTNYDIKGLLDVEEGFAMMEVIINKMYAYYNDKNAEGYDYFTDFLTNFAEDYLNKNDS